MDLLLKRYFWVITLSATGLCAGFAGRTAANLAVHTWLGSESGKESSARPRFALPPPERSHTKEVEAIVQRNVFCSRCAPIKANETQAAEVTDNTPRKSDLPLELLSTMVVPSDERWSMAVIRETSTNEKAMAMYAAGSLLPGGVARVERVIERRVYLLNSGHHEFLELAGGSTPAPSAPAAMPPPVASMGNSGDPMDNDIQRGVRCNGSQCEIDRPLIDKLLANTTALATSARFVPSVRDGRPNGFKLYAIRPSSIFAKIGLENGDTVKSINGMEMSTPDQALGVYTKVRSASHLSVTVDRRGETATLDYTIR